MNYQKQAQEIADRLGIKLTVKHKGYGKHFAGDKDSRHIFRCRLSRGRKSYSFDFGQSIAAGSKEPTMYDVLTCLTKYDPDTYSNFVAEYGIEDVETYKAVVKEYEAMERLFTWDELELLQEIQ